jgi:hypothetical protein
LLLVAASCSDSDPIRKSEETGDLVAVYFIDGHGLIPEYQRLPAGDPVEGLVTLLERGPIQPEHATFIQPGTFLSSFEREGREELGVELASGFWSLGPGERFAAAAQIVFTVATLEEGRSVLLLDGTVPGELLDGSFEPLQQPLDRTDFAELEPWIQVTRPVAGAVVGRRVVTDISLREGRGSIAVEQEGRELASAPTQGGTLVLDLEGARVGDVILTISVKARDGSVHSTQLPLRYVE